MCQNSAPPKDIFIVRLLMQGKLVTCNYLERIGVHVDHSCCLYSRAIEILDHLFFDCEFAAAVWKGVTEWCGIQRCPAKWCVERDFLITQCTTNSGKQRLYRYVFTVLVYQVWTERNQRRMQGRQRTVDAIIQQSQFILAWCS